MQKLRFEPNNGHKVLLPEKGTRGPREKYPWRTMEVEDSFTVLAEQASASSVRSMASAKGRDLGKRFSVTIGAECVYVTREA
jgi:hypothetical protein